MTDTTTEKSAQGYAQPRLTPGPTPAPRSVGPVTLATGGAAAVTALVCWVLTLFGIDVPDTIQGSITIIVVLVAGFTVPPRKTGRHA